MSRGWPADGPLSLPIACREDPVQSCRCEPETYEQLLIQTSRGAEPSRSDQATDHQSVHRWRRFQHYRAEQGIDAERAHGHQVSQRTDRGGIRLRFRQAGQRGRPSAQHLRSESPCRLFHRRRAAEGYGPHGRRQLQGAERGQPRGAVPRVGRSAGGGRPPLRRDPLVHRAPEPPQGEDPGHRRQHLGARQSRYGLQLQLLLRRGAAAGHAARGAARLYGLHRERHACGHLRRIHVGRGQQREDDALHQCQLGPGAGDDPRRETFLREVGIFGRVRPFPDVRQRGNLPLRQAGLPRDRRLRLGGPSHFPGAARRRAHLDALGQIPRRRGDLARRHSLGGAEGGRAGHRDHGVGGPHARQGAGRAHQHVQPRTDRAGRDAGRHARLPDAARQERDQQIFAAHGEQGSKLGGSAGVVGASLLARSKLLHLL